MDGLVRTATLWGLLSGGLLLLTQGDPRNVLHWALAGLLAMTMVCLLAPRAPQPGGRRSGRLRIT